MLARGIVPCDLTVEALENTLIRGEEDNAFKPVENLQRADFLDVLDYVSTGCASM